MTKLPQLAGCLTLELGWAFWVWVTVAIIVIASLIALLIWFLGSRQTTANDALTVSHKNSGITLGTFGTLPLAIVGCGLVLLLIGGIGFGIYLISEQFRTEQSVVVNSPSRSVTLEDVLEKYKDDTRVRIDVKEAAKRFAFTGRYEGVCISDLFESICRQHASQISCNPDRWNQILTVDVVKPR
jgi:hypothetical protein